MKKKSRNPGLPENIPSGREQTKKLLNDLRKKIGPKDWQRVKREFLRLEAKVLYERREGD